MADVDKLKINARLLIRTDDVINFLKSDFELKLGEPAFTITEDREGKPRGVLLIGANNTFVGTSGQLRPIEDNTNVFYSGLGAGYVLPEAGQNTLGGVKITDNANTGLNIFRGTNGLLYATPKDMESRSLMFVPSNTGGVYPNYGTLHFDASYYNNSYSTTGLEPERNDRLKVNLSNYNGGFSISPKDGTRFWYNADANIWKIDGTLQADTILETPHIVGNMLEVRKNDGDIIPQPMSTEQIAGLKMYSIGENTSSYADYELGVNNIGTLLIRNNKTLNGYIPYFTNNNTDGVVIRNGLNEITTQPLSKLSVKYGHLSSAQSDFEYDPIINDGMTITIPRTLQDLVDYEDPSTDGTNTAYVSSSDREKWNSAVNARIISVQYGNYADAEIRNNTLYLPRTSVSLSGGPGITIGIDNTISLSPVTITKTEQATTELVLGKNKSIELKYISDIETDEYGRVTKIIYKSYLIRMEG